MHENNENLLAVAWWVTFNSLDLFNVYLKFSRENSPGIDIAGVGFNAFIVAQDLSGGGRGHRREQKRIPNSELRDLGLQFGPIVEISGSDIPKVVLEAALAHWTAFVSLISSKFFGQFSTGFHSTIVDCLKYLLVQELGIFTAMESKTL